MLLTGKVLIHNTWLRESRSKFPHQGEIYRGALQPHKAVYSVKYLRTMSHVVLGVKRMLDNKRTLAASPKPVTCNRTV